MWFSERKRKILTSKSDQYYFLPQIAQITQHNFTSNSNYFMTFIKTTPFHHPSQQLDSLQQHDNQSALALGESAKSAGS